ncbi:MAG: hypothetical protein HDT14_12995 [Oscillibacter sp.]|nr:hypothetical protein [Oscillibacter sp.]
MNPDNPFCGKSVAVTGKLDNYTRDGIQARLRELGARPVSVVSKRTDYLILGKRPGNKLVKALSLGIAVLSEQEFEDMVSQSKGSEAGDRSAASLYMQQGSRL